MLDKLKSLLAAKFGVDFVNGFLKDCGEGKHGTKLQAVYRFFAKHAIATGVLVGGADFVLRYLSGNNLCGTSGACMIADGIVWFVSIKVLLPSGLYVAAHAALAPDPRAQFDPR